MLNLESSVCCSSVLRLLAMTLLLIIGIEWSQPIVVGAQPNGPSTVAPGNDELPPIQEVEKVEVRSPFYKKWWFWTIVAAVIGGAAIAVAAGGGGGSGGNSAPGPSGPVTVTGPAPH
jgi:hypothetical protein